METHSRTGFVDVRISGTSHRIPVTHVKIFGWYDNEMGSYTYRLGELTAHVAQEPVENWRPRPWAGSRASPATLGGRPARLGGAALL